MGNMDPNEMVTLLQFLAAIYPEANNCTGFELTEALGATSLNCFVELEAADFVSSEV